MPCNRLSTLYISIFCVASILYDCLVTYFSFPDVTIVRRDVDLSGSVLIAPTAQGAFPRGSCLQVYVQEETYCGDCDIPILAETIIGDPRLNSRFPRSIPYNLTLKGVTNGNYFLTARMSMGWCAGGSELMHDGDYLNDDVTVITLDGDSRSVTKDVSIEKFDLKNARDNPLKGKILFTSVIVQ